MFAGLPNQSSQLTMVGLNVTGMSIVNIYKKYVPNFMYCYRCFGNKLLTEMYKSAEQEAEEMDTKDGLLRVDSALTILIGKVCQKWNVSSVIANSRLVQEFKTKIWRLYQAPAKAKTQEVTNGTCSTWKFITMGNSSFWQRVCLEQMSRLRGQIFGMLPAETRIGQFKFPARQPYARLLFSKL